jgi:DEAD/DEAH box helicase domain-containing protein
MFDDEDEISCYQDLILAEYGNLDSNAFAFEKRESRLSDDQIASICSTYSVPRERLTKTGLLIRYPDGSFRTMHIDIIFRAVNARAASWSNKIPLEFKLVKPSQELIPSFTELDVGETKATLQLPNDVSDAFIEALRDSGYGKLAYHQVHYLKNILGGHDKCCLLVSPTASGKSLVFYITVLAAVLSGLSEHGTRAIVIYPRKALASDQLQKFMRVVVALNARLSKRETTPITLGIDDGDTPRSSNSEEVKRGETFRGLKCIEKGCTGSLRYATVKSNSAVACEKCKRVYNEIRPTKGDIWASRPSIIFTNLSSLNRRMMMKASQSIVGSSVQWIVLDEAHVYREEIGGHARWMLRRIIGRFDVLTKGDIRVLISSATIHNPRGFVKKLLGIGDSIYYEEYPKILEASQTKRKKLTVNTIIAPNPLRSAESLAEELSLLLGTWGFAHGGKSIIFIDNVSEIERMRDFVINDIIMSRQAQNDHIDVSKSAAVADVSDNFSWQSLANGLSDIKSTELSKIYDHHYAELNQDERARVEETFKARKSGVLFATSTLELGMDIGNIAAIVQYKIPLTAESYVQRIGRAGRSDEVGRIALGFLVLTNSPSQIRYVLENEYKKMLEPQVEIPVAWENEEIRKQHVIFSILDFEASRNKNTFLDFTTEVRPNWSDLGDALDSLKNIIKDARVSVDELRRYERAIEDDSLSVKLLDQLLDAMEKKVDFGLANYPKLSGMDIDENLSKLRNSEDKILKAKREIEGALRIAKKIEGQVTIKELDEYESAVTKLQDSLSKVLGDMEKMWS